LDGYGIGLVVGFGAGIAIGISIGKKQKPWSELTAAEKKLRIISIPAGGVLFVALVVVFLIRLSSWLWHCVWWQRLDLNQRPRVYESLLLSELISTLLNTP